MSFSISGHNLPSISSYKDCDELFKKRLGKLTSRRSNNWDTETLPLCAWRDTTKRIELHEKEFDPHYRLYYHRTPILSYYPDGHVLFNAGYHSQSTRVFFRNLCPVRWDVVCASSNYFYVRDDEWHTVDRRASEGPLRLDPNGKVLNGVPFEYSKTVANMPRRKEIRKQIAPFVQWYKAMTKVSDSMLSVMVDEDNIEALRATSLGFARNTLIDMIDKLRSPKADEDYWRRVCTNAFFAQVSAYMMYGAPRDLRYSAQQHAGPVMREIERALWSTCDGWETHKIVVPAGEKP